MRKKNLLCLVSSSLFQSSRYFCIAAGSLSPLSLEDSDCPSQMLVYGNQVASAPGSLFVEEKPVSANDTWRKLHSDPLLLIRQQEQAALARIKNNPVKMEQLRKEVQCLIHFDCS